MKSVILSIQPKWCELIASGKKTVEVRRTRPKLETPFKCYIYCTQKEFNKTIFDYLGLESVRVVADGQGKVIGEFGCDEIYKIKRAGIGYHVVNGDEALTNETAAASCLNFYDLQKYLGDKGGYGWHISNLKIYDTPKELGEFRKGQIMRDCGYGRYNAYDMVFTRPPQNWAYCEPLEEI